LSFNQETSEQTQGFRRRLEEKMSEEEFEVRGAHEHEVEHAAEHGPGLAQYVAIFTAVLSTVGAIVSYEGGATQNQAMLYKNEAVLKKAHASDQWAFYQSKSAKQHMMELAMDMAPKDKVDYYRTQKEKYEKEKKEIQAKAEQLDEESRKDDELSEETMHPHHRLAQAMTLIQISISLASITALTRRRWLFGFALASAAGGLGLAGIVWLS
jgi:hypothetical protein